MRYGMTQQEKDLLSTYVTLFQKIYGREPSDHTWKWFLYCISTTAQNVAISRMQALAK